MSTGSSIRVLGSLDLVDLIAKHLAKPDLVQLARASKLCFGSTVYLVWAEVRGVHNLLRLIPGVECIKRNGEAWRLTIPDLESADLTRFHLYAAHVFRLHVLPKGQTANYRVFGWEYLLQDSRFYLPLPNLRVITSECKSEDEIFIRWIILLLSPETVTLYVHSLNWSLISRVSAQSAGCLLKLMSEKSPGMRELSVFPVDTSVARPGTSDEGLILHDPLVEIDIEDGGLESRPLPYCEYIGKFTELQYLATTLLIFEDGGLRVLANLPHLEKISLTCACPYKIESSLVSAEFGDRLFPSLRSLELVRPDMICVPYVWSLGQLVRRLTEVEILFYNPGIGGGYDSVTSFIPEICERSPDIEKLVIDFVAVTGFCENIETQTFCSLAMLPLRVLDLRDAHIVDIHSACEVMSQYHVLREFYLEGSHLPVDHLVPFALIPRLERLHVAVEWNVSKESVRLAERVPHASSSVRFLQLSNAPRFSTGDHGAEIVDRAARVLAACFPKLESVSYVRTSADKTAFNPPGPDCVRLMNAIRNVQETRGFGEFSEPVEM